MTCSVYFCISLALERGSVLINRIVAGRSKLVLEMYCWVAVADKDSMKEWNIPTKFPHQAAILGVTFSRSKLTWFVS